MKRPWKSASSSEPHNHDNGQAVTFRLNARLQPMHRGEVFEDPLDEALAKRGIGEIEGGGTMQSDNGEIECCDIVVFVHDPVAANAATIAAELEGLGAPLGSRYRVDGADDPVPFGVSGGLALYLNGTDLPDEVYLTQDVNELIERLDEAIGYTGKMMSHWEGPTETALYFYGDPYDVMAAALAPVIAAHPLAAQSRMEQIA